MTRDEQKALVAALASNMAQHITILIDRGDVPEDWNGKQLRQLLADHCERNTLTMGLSERRKYNNTVLVNNL